MMPLQQSEIDSREVLGVALGGGGMKGVAHLGVLAALEQRGLAPSVLAGSSVGAVIGAFYANGTVIREVFDLAERASLWSLFSPRLDGRSLVGVDPLRSLLAEHFGDREISSLKIPFAAVCTDLVTGEEVALRDGSIVDAVLASAAIPGIFPPHRQGARLLVDGALCNNVPVSVLAEMGATTTIGVQLYGRHSGSPFDNSDNSSDASFEGSSGGSTSEAPHREHGKTNGTTRDKASSHNAFTSWADRLIKKVWDDEDDLPGIRMVLERSVELVLTRLEELALERCPPDVLISPDVSDIRSLDFANDRRASLDRGRLAVDLKSTELDSLSRRLDVARRAERAERTERTVRADRNERNNLATE